MGALLYFGVKLLLIIGVLLFARRVVKKGFPKLSQPIRIIASIIACCIICSATDALFALNHRDPLFAIPVAVYGDGGSVDFIGPCYYVSKRAAYMLGDEPPFFNYKVRPWFFIGQAPAFNISPNMKQQLNIT